MTGVTSFMNRRSFLALTGAAGLTLPWSAALAGQDRFKLVYFHNYPPFSWDDGEAMRGLLIDSLTEAIEKRMGIPTEHMGYPWKRAQHLVRLGKADAFCTVPTDERRAYTLISRVPTVLATFTPFVRRGSPAALGLRNARSLDDLTGFRVGHYLGSGWAKKNLKGRNLELHEASTLDAALAMLSVGRVDVVIDTSQVIRYRIKQLGMQARLEELPQVLDQAPFALCIGRGSAHASILPEFERTMQAVHDDGTYDRLASAYA